MQEERKTSMGSAIVDVFDAGVTLAKAEINALFRKVSELAKAKGLGVVLLLASLVPLSLAAIFFILTLYFGLVALGLPWWGAALVMTLASLALTAALVYMGMGKLSEELPARDRALSDDERLEAEYLAERRRSAEAGVPQGAVIVTGTGATAQTVAPVYTPAQTGSAVTVVTADPTVRVVEVEEGAYTHAVSGHVTHHGGGHGHGEHDPNLQNPQVIEGAEGISVSTQPTYAEDMKRGGTA
ncbi:phage holin family protein [Deinococcus lacus]|uniref:Phage holin family protein n=1 Tax=Deinococcus lacus TaxID=392561 RepID=A0ABW1YGQ9_9DEIO